MSTLRFPEPDYNENDVDVPVALAPLYRQRVIGTATPDDSHECTNGIGSLLREEGDPGSGRDLQLPCKRRNCPVCGPKGQRTKCANILRDFDDDKMHAVEIEDGGKEWETLRKALQRSGALYHRVPACNGKSVVLTTADVGEVVEDPMAFVGHVVANQPCDPEDRRRMTSSRPWKGAGGSGTGRWRRVGRTHMPLAGRLQVYGEEDCDPTEIAAEDRAPGVIAAHDVRLPAWDSVEMSRLARRLNLERDDPPPEGASGWERATW